MAKGKGGRGKPRGYNRGKSFSSYGGKSMLQFAKSFAEPSAQLATAYLKKALGLNTETKWVDTVETNTGTNSSAQALANPLLIPQGDTANSRNGDSVRLTSYTCRLRIMANTAATTPTFVRIIFVKFKDSRGEQPGASQFLDSASRITSFYNMGDTILSTGYTILFDKTIPINISSSDDSTKMVTFNYKPLQHHLKWLATDTSGAITNLMDGYVRGYIMTSETGSNTPNYWADHRVKFVDN